MKLTGVFAFLALALPVALSAPTLVRRGGYEGGSDDSSDYGKSTDDSSTSTSAEGSGSWATTTTTTLYTSTTTSSESVWTTTSSYTPYPSETGVPSSSVSSSSSSSSSVATCEFDRSTGDVICEAASSSASSSSASGSDQSGEDVIEHHEGGETHGFDDNDGDEGDDDSHEGGYDGAGNNSGLGQDDNAGSRSSSCSSSSSGSGDGKWHNSNDDRDIRLLNLALSVSHMSQAFYNQSLCAYSKDDFAGKGYPSWVRDRYEQIKEHQDEHVASLYKAIHSAGGSAIMGCQYRFPEVNHVEDFVERSEAIETIAASAFNGLVKHLQDDEYRTAISSMMATQARHATWINSDVRHKNPWNTAYETPISLNMTYNLINDFIVPGSCPSANDISTPLPHNLVDYSSLELPERIKAGHKTAISFNASSTSGSEGSHDDNKRGLYAAFKVGTEAYYEKVWVENGQQYVMVPEEVKAKGAVYIVIVEKDEEREADVRSSDASSPCSASPSSTCSSGSGSGTENQDDGVHYEEDKADGGSGGAVVSSSSFSSTASASSGGDSTSSTSSSSASSSASSAFGENNDCSGSNDSNRRRRHHNVIAGPALVMFPFNSEGKPVAGLQTTSKW